MSDNQPEEKGPRTFTEELEVAGNQAVDKIKGIIKQGNVRRLIIRNAEGRVIYDTTLTMGVGIGGALALLGSPVILAVAVVVGAVSRVKIEIVREVKEGDVIEEGKKKVDIDVNEE